MFKSINGNESRTKSESGQPNGGGSNYGKIEDIVRDMYDGSPLYLVNIKGEVKTFKEESLTPLKKDLKRSRR